jgi:hypothetical protein
MWEIFKEGGTLIAATKPILNFDFDTSILTSTRAVPGTGTQEYGTCTCTVRMDLYSFWKARTDDRLTAFSLAFWKLVLPL